MGNVFVCYLTDFLALETASAGLTSVVNPLRGAGRRLGVSTLGGFIPCSGVSLVCLGKKLIPTMRSL